MQPPVAVQMEFPYNTQDSRLSRSRSNSRLSSQLQSLNLQHHPSSPPLTGQHGSSSLGRYSTSDQTSSPNYLDQHQQSPEAFISGTAVPEQLTPFPVFSEPDLDTNWSYLTSTEEHSENSVPLVTVEQHSSFGDRSNSNPTAMR